MNMARAGYRVIEDDAQEMAQQYLRRHVASTETDLIWLQGVSNKQGQVFYANNKHITFRIRQ
jgi:hypothetical protein